MKNKRISNSSSGIIADGNVTIVNNTSKYLEETITAIMKPALKELGENIKTKITRDISLSIGQKIKSFIENDLFNKLKQDVRAQNLTFHLERVIDYFKLNSGSIRESELKDLSKSFERLDLFADWVEGAEKIKKEDDILSKMWEKWLIELRKGEEISNQKIFLEKMKLLNQDDAAVLLSFRDTFDHYSKLSKGKIDHIYQKLIRLELIKRNYFVEFVLFLFSIIISSIAFYSIKIFPDIILILVPLILGSVVTFLKYFLLPNYKLTWLGNNILRYARDFNDD